MSEDCYFYVDMEPDVLGEDRKISPLCVDCRNKEFQNVGWFWKGSELGYGPWVYACNICNKVIHDPDQEQYEEIETTN